MGCTQERRCWSLITGNKEQASAGLQKTGQNVHISMIQVIIKNIELQVYLIMASCFSWLSDSSCTPGSRWQGTRGCQLEEQLLCTCCSCEGERQPFPTSNPETLSGTTKPHPEVRAPSARRKTYAYFWFLPIFLKYAKFRSFTFTVLNTQVQGVIFQLP